MRFKDYGKRRTEYSFCVDAEALGFQVSGTFVGKDWNYSEATLPGYDNCLLRLRSDICYLAGIVFVEGRSRICYLENLLEGMAFIKGKVLADNIGRELDR